MNFLRIAGLGPKKTGPDKKYATFNRRMLAATIDSLLIAILIAPVIDWLFDSMYGPVPLDWMALRMQMSQQSDEHAAMQLFWQTMYTSGFMARWVVNAVWQLIVLGTVTGWCWHKWSATPGKMLFRIKIVDADTEAPITDRQILLRLFGYIPSSVCLLAGFFWIGIDKRRQAWHDKIANTLVVVVPRKKVAIPGSPAADPSDSPAPSTAE
jgi:uncharacterized RDD family membrane protein YckC